MIIDDKTRLCGGLAAWQQKKIADFIEVHLDENISLWRLAEIAPLSRSHFTRAFKRPQLTEGRPMRRKRS
jgi:AraC-like DNA-binding protein